MFDYITREKIWTSLKDAPPVFWAEHENFLSLYLFLGTWFFKKIKIKKMLADIWSMQGKYNN